VCSTHSANSAPHLLVTVVSYASCTTTLIDIAVELTACMLLLRCCLNRECRFEASLFKMYNHLLQDFFKHSSYMPIGLMPYYAAKLRMNIIVWEYLYNDDNTQVLGYRVHTCWGDNKAVFCGDAESQDVQHVPHRHTGFDKRETPQHYAAYCCCHD
jgi:hypothetical protein